MSSERTPTLSEVIDRALFAFGSCLPKWMPAKVVRYDATKQLVDVKILVQQPYFDEEDERQVASIAVIPNVPVLFPGAGGYRVTFPISDGNTVIDDQTVKATTGAVFFADRSIDKWLSGQGQEVDPAFDHQHSTTDAVFMPGLNPFGAPLGDVPTDHMTAGADSSAGVQIHFHADKVVLGEEATAEYMFLCETLLADIKSNATALNTILLGGTTGGPTAQNITQAAQYALSQLYIRLQITPSPYLSTKWKNK